jgi:sugar phosphate isomerase/epimerase
METPSLEASLRQIRQAGFDGVELGVPDEPGKCAPLRRLLDELGLAVIVQQWTSGNTPAEHADSFERQYERALPLKPLYVNSHTGKDYYPLKENLVVFDRASRLERVSGVPVVHETHRGRALFSTPSTNALLAERPELRLTADFSHWCCVHESLLEDQAAVLRRPIERSYHIHARVGYSQGPQIPDPRAPEWESTRQTHLVWWQTIIEQRRKEGCPVLPICPEFGPPPYMITLPHTRQPIADLWEVNLFMRDWLKCKLG